MYKDREETTHGEIGDKQHTSTYIYIYIYIYINENKYNVYHK